jgi:serine/threonine-protein kinase
VSLSAGTKIGSYEVLHLLGKGGMGEVYRARDAKLGRDAALKVLPEHLVGNKEYIGRFQREAQALASVSHPNIAQIYGLEESGDFRCIVMELVEGPTLAEKIRQGPIPLEDALTIARQIAEALEAAHDRGIVHRDLKPGNIKVAPDGKVKILDFGLAKSLDSVSGSAQFSDSPTASVAATQAGLLLGTPGYMSPEQGKGKPADTRSDIWAFGAVLYEMLTGRVAFEGETAVEILGGVMKGEPDWTALPPDTPPLIHSLLRRCLQKDRNRRIHHIADARLDVEEALSHPATSLHPAAPTRTRERLLWMGALATVAVLVGFAVRLPDDRPQSPGSSVVRLSVTLPPGRQLSGEAPVTLSPDGSVLAYISNGQLYLKTMDSLESKIAGGAASGQAPFFSTDGKWVGFFGQGKLKKISIAGGSPEEIADAPAVRGAAWGPDNTIYFSPSAISGLRKVSASGGMVSEFTTLDPGKGEVSHRWPQVLPGGKALLFTVWKGPGFDERQLELLILETNERRVLVKNAHFGRYSPSGHMVYVRESVLMAVPFDLERLEVTGPPSALGELVQETPEGAAFALSDSGSLAYVPGSSKASERQLAWIDRKGTVQILPAPIKAYGDVSLSPNGAFAAVEIAGATRSIWLYDFARKALSPLTTMASSQFPRWSADGKYVIYRGTRSGYRNLFRKAVDGSGEEEQLTTTAKIPVPVSVSRDNQFLAFSDGDPAFGTGTDIWTMRLDGDRTPEVFLRTKANEGQPQFSPDGNWMAYSSNESGQGEVYVRPFPGPGQRIPISVNGGGDPQWSADGRELFYRSGSKQMVVNIRTGPAFSVSPPQLVYDVRSSTPRISPDGQRFLVSMPTEAELPSTQIHIVLNWAEELKKRPLQ